MSDGFYSDARLYDRLFPGGESAVDFYRAQADRQGGSVLELGYRHRARADPHRLRRASVHRPGGLSPDMLSEAQRTADERALPVEWVLGDMRDFDLGRTFDLVFIAANSLLHLQEAADLLSCFRSVRAHLAPGARFVFDVFNPNVRLLVDADGVRRARESLSFTDPDRGDVRVGVAETYDPAAQVTRGTWHLLDRHGARLPRPAARHQEHLPAGAPAAPLARRTPARRPLRRLVGSTVHRGCGDPALRVRVGLKRRVRQPAAQVNHGTLAPLRMPALLMSMYRAVPVGFEPQEARGPAARWHTWFSEEMEYSAPGRSGRDLKGLMCQDLRMHAPGAATTLDVSGTQETPSDA